MRRFALPESNHALHDFVIALFDGDVVDALKPREAALMTDRQTLSPLGRRFVALAVGVVGAVGLVVGVGFGVFLRFGRDFVARLRDGGFDRRRLRGGVLGLGFGLGRFLRPGFGFGFVRGLGRFRCPLGCRCCFRC